MAWVNCYACDYRKHCCKIRGFYDHEVKSFVSCSAWRLFNQGERLKKLRWEKADRTELYDGELLNVGEIFNGWEILGFKDEAKKANYSGIIYRAKCVECGNETARVKGKLESMCTHRMRIGPNAYTTNYTYTLKGKIGDWEPVKFVGHHGVSKTFPVWEFKCKCCGATVEATKDQIMRRTCSCKKGVENGESEPSKS